METESPKWVEFPPYPWDESKAGKLVGSKQERFSNKDVFALFNQAVLNFLLV